MHIFFATTNRGKIHEFTHFCADALTGIVNAVHTSLTSTLVGQMPEIAETENTFEGNALLKCRGTAQWLNSHTDLDPATLVIADDSGLCVDVLDGAPGVLSARWAGTNATAQDNRDKLVAELTELNLPTTSAKVVCILAVCRIDEQPLQTGFGGTFAPHRFFTGICNGDVHVQARGDRGFGFDSHFVPMGEVKTFAEMDWQQKVSHSHRGKALEQLRNYLSTIGSK